MDNNVLPDNMLQAGNVLKGSGRKRWELSLNKEKERLRYNSATSLISVFKNVLKSDEINYLLVLKENKDVNSSQ